MSVIFLSKLALILTSHLLMRTLFISGFKTSFAHMRPILRPRVCNHPTSAIKTRAIIIDYGIVYDSTVNIGIPYESSIYIYHGGIVAERPSRPCATYKTYTPVTITIVNAAIVAYM